MREGYIFLYWKGSEYQPGDKYTVTEDHTFEAQWEKKSDPAPIPVNPIPPKTADNSNIILWMVLMNTALLSFAAMIYLRRRKNEQE